MEAASFSSRFKLLTGHPPFLWQGRLYARLLADDLPSQCDIPTGLGKTSVLALWLLALAEQTLRGARLTLPRRLVYVVNRRVVVDQATTDAEALLKALQDKPELAPVADALRSLAALPARQPFALSTLRGQHADNREWSADPCRPAIIVGTVDMIGSRLLFSGYGGLGRYDRSKHAALLGQDALVVFDEAQLAPAFLRTLQAIEHARCEPPGASVLSRPFAVLSLTATQPHARAASEASPPEKPPFALEPEDYLEEEVSRRVQAPKTLRFVPAPAGEATGGKADDALAARMAEAAVELAGPDGAVVVFANTVTLLDKVLAALLAGPHKVPDNHCLRFNGQMRGHERDRQFSDGNGANEVFKIFRQRQKDRPARDYPVFLLATSAGEVGVNFDADHAVCDLVSLERMAQRFGRVNRFGDGKAQIRVFLPADLAKHEKKELIETHRLLAGLPAPSGEDDPAAADAHSASPEALRAALRHPNAARAYTPSSEPPPLDGARLDDWSLTSLSQEDFARPQVSYWLHGVTPDDDQAVTSFAWREELRYLPDAGNDSKKEAADLAKTVPPLTRELLQLPKGRAVKWLMARASRRKKILEGRKHGDPHPGHVAAVLTPAGKWEGWALADFEDKENFERDIVGATILLPTSFGGLNDGFVDESHEEKALDVLQEEGRTAKTYRRALLHGSPNGNWQAFDLLAGPDGEPLETGPYATVIKKMADAFNAGTSLRYRLLPRKNEPAAADAGDGVTSSPVFRTEFFAASAEAANAHEADTPSLRGKKEVLLEPHLAEAKKYAGIFGARLALPAPIQEALTFAAKWHDLGKNRPHWQRAVGNPGKEVWAKSPYPRFNRQETLGYRHEFGSLMEVLHKEDSELKDHPERDLVLHLIAAHHGYGRPGFGPQAYDVPKYLIRQCAEAADEAELRFDRLQRRFGWWGLAYLEALVKCADGLASDAADPTEPDALAAPEAAPAPGVPAQAELF